jgi:hypothetical protein
MLGKDQLKDQIKGSITGAKLKQARLGKSWNFQHHKVTVKVTLGSVHREKKVKPNTAYN